MRDSHRWLGAGLVSEPLRALFGRRRGREGTPGSALSVVAVARMQGRLAWN